MAVNRGERAMAASIARPAQCPLKLEGVPSPKAVMLVLFSEARLRSAVNPPYLNRYTLRRKNEELCYRRLLVRVDSYSLFKRRGRAYDNIHPPPW